jgi:hypothetical protein
MNIAFSVDQFPSRNALVRGTWAPILFAPNPDTPERLVLAVAAVSDAEFFIAAADASKRLACLYGPAAATALLAQQSAVKALREELAGSGKAALDRVEFAFSGLSVGKQREGEATSMQELATRWLVTIASLHDEKLRAPAEQDDFAENAVAAIEAQADNDRLPVLVYKALEEIDPQLGSYFSAEIRSRARRAPRPAPHKVFIGFAGSNVVANFATLKPARTRVMVDHVKRLMWDLARFRDDEAARISRERTYEMMVYRRGDDDPEYDPRKAAEVGEMVQDLEEQGAKDAIRVQSRTAVGQIADHLRLVERAALPL